MGCNCGKGTTQWTYVAPDGKQTVFRTEVEARAMKIRNGNTGEVRAL